MRKIDDLYFDFATPSINIMQKRDGKKTKSSLFLRKEASESSKTKEA